MNTETIKIIEKLYYCADALGADPNTCREAANVISQQRQRIAELEEAVAQQRNRADTAESFICKLCAECDREDHDGVTVMQKSCCSWFPECGKFSLRQRWIPVTERLPEKGENVLAFVRCEDCVVAYRCKNFWRVLWDNYILDECEVTHWMPLPGAPKEVKR